MLPARGRRRGQGGLDVRVGLWLCVVLFRARVCEFLAARVSAVAPRISGSRTHRIFAPSFRFYPVWFRATPFERETVSRFGGTHTPHTRPTRPSLSFLAFLRSLLRSLVLGSPLLQPACPHSVPPSLLSMFLFVPPPPFSSPLPLLFSPSALDSVPSLSSPVTHHASPVSHHRFILELPHDH